MKGKMKAALFYGQSESIRLEMIDIPEIGDGDILLKVKACGICGSDVRTYFNGIEDRYKIPVILGHEIIAEVYKVGDKVNDYKPGERVVVAPIYGCGHCEFCLSGRENLCEDIVVFGCNFDGAFAEYMKIPAKGVERGALIKLGDELTDKEGTMIESFSCCLHGLRRLRIKPGNSVIIFGSGPIGLAHMVLAKRFGAEKVAIVDIIKDRLKQATSFGADITINAMENNWKDTVFHYFGKNGIDFVITAAPSIETLKNSLKLVKKGGSILIFGGLPSKNMLSCDPNFIHYNEITITGSIDATTDDMRRIACMASSLDLGRFISQSISLDEIKKGMEIINNRKELKVIIEMAEK